MKKEAIRKLSNFKKILYKNLCLLKIKITQFPDQFYLKNTFQATTI